MSTTAIVSYDDTPNDYDALMFARVLAEAGAEPILAYVRHAHPDRAASASSSRSTRPSALLERGARRSATSTSSAG